MGLIFARRAQRTSFKKFCTLTNPPKDNYEPTPIGTFPFMSGSPFSFSDDITLCLRLTLSSSVLLIFTSWVWRSINFASSVFSLTISRWRSTFWAINLCTVFFSVSSSFFSLDIFSNWDCIRYRTSSPACSFSSWRRLFDVRKQCKFVFSLLITCVALCNLDFKTKGWVSHCIAVASFIWASSSSKNGKAEHASLSSWNFCILILSLARVALLLGFLNDVRSGNVKFLTSSCASKGSWAKYTGLVWNRERQYGLKWLWQPWYLLLYPVLCLQETSIVLLCRSGSM